MIPNHIKIGNAKEFLLEYISHSNFSKIGILVDENTKISCLNKLKDSLDFNYHEIEIKSGEENKNLQTCSNVWGILTKLNFDRKSLIINLGGGVICDLGGFVASTYKRGIQFINIPTTLLGQVDASVGGKLGIDFNNYKNQIGIFREPNLIIVDPEFLASLPKRELRSGFAEVIKHCIIRDEKKLDQILNSNWEKSDWLEIVKHSIKIKSKVVNEDMKEDGPRKILNFGHTIGHAIETTYINKENRFLHGEAISIGIICEAYLSHKLNKLSTIDLNKIVDIIKSIFGNNTIGYFEEIVRNAYHDKKNIDDKIRTCILNKIGQCEYDHEISPNHIIESLEYYNNIIK